MFPPNNLPLPAETLLVTDELYAQADFILHRHLVSSLKGASSSKCVFVTVSGDVGRWKSVIQRSNVKVAQYMESGVLTFLDAMPHIVSAMDGGSDKPLMNLLEELKRLLNVSLAEIRSSVILDDIASLQWMGIPAPDLVRFTRALSALCRKNNISLVIRHHVTTPGEPDDVLKHLLQLCTYHLDVFPLSSGRSGAVSGQIALHCGPGTAKPVHRLIPRSAAIQYRLTDVGSVFFDRGTGSGVL